MNLMDYVSFLSKKKKKEGKNELFNFSLEVSYKHFC